MNNLLRMAFTGLLLLAVMTHSMPASAIDSEFPSLRELARKAGDAMRDIKDGITGGSDGGYVEGPGRAPGDSEEKHRNLIGLIFILVGIGLLMVAISGMRWEFGWFMPFIPGFILVLFLWWLFPFFPVFLLFIPLIGFRFMKRGGHPGGPSYPPAPTRQQDHTSEPTRQGGSSSQGHVTEMPVHVRLYAHGMHRHHDDGPPDNSMGYPDDDGRYS